MAKETYIWQKRPTYVVKYLEYPLEEEDACAPFPRAASFHSEFALGRPEGFKGKRRVEGWRGDRGICVRERASEREREGEANTAALQIHTTWDMNKRARAHTHTHTHTHTQVARGHLSEMKAFATKHAHAGLI